MMYKKKTAQDTIPYKTIYSNGVIETKEGTFTKAYLLTDINFRAIDDEEQLRVFSAYGDLLNSFSVKFQIFIHNHMSSRARSFDKVRLLPQQDGLNKYRSEMNEIFLENLARSKNNVTQDKYLIISATSDKQDEAFGELAAAERELQKQIRKISPGAEALPQTASKRLKTLYTIFNPDGVFENSVDENGNMFFDIEKVYKNGLTSKDAIAPSAFDFKPNYFMMGETYAETVFLEDVPNYLTDAFMEDLEALPFAMCLSIHYSPVDPASGIKMVKDKITNINSQIAQSQKSAAREGYSGTLVSPEIQIEQQQTLQLYEDLISRDQKMFFSTMVITAFAESKEELKDEIKSIMSIGNKHLAPFKPLSYMQELGMRASLPLAINEIPIKRLYTTSSASIFIPYSATEMIQDAGIYYGLNRISDNPIIYSRLSGQNYNGLIFGSSGSGKSFSAKLEMLSVLLKSSKNVVYVIDPEKEYINLAKGLNGEVVELSASSRTFLNPLDMDLEYSADSDPVSMKADYILGLIDILLGDRVTLDPIAKSIVDRCVRNIYRGYVEHLETIGRQNGYKVTNDPKAAPTLIDLFYELKRQPEAEAETVANILEIYATGSQSVFAHRTNVDADNSFVVYDIMNLGTGLKALGLYVCLNDIWNKMIQNRKKDIFTWVYIDEFYLLLQSDSAATFLMNIWKRARKWNGVPTGIMQNTEDLLSSPQARNIINNTSFIYALALPALDRTNLQEILKLPETMLQYITDNQTGTGIMYNGKTTVPFRNEFPKDTLIYKLLSTSGT